MFRRPFFLSYKPSKLKGQVQSNSGCKRKCCLSIIEYCIIQVCSGPRKCLCLYPQVSYRNCIHTVQSHRLARRHRHMGRLLPILQRPVMEKSKKVLSLLVLLHLDPGFYSFTKNPLEKYLKQTSYKFRLAISNFDVELKLSLHARLFVLKPLDFWSLFSRESLFSYQDISCRL